MLRRVLGLTGAVIVTLASIDISKAGYVQTWLDSKGGCSPGTLMTMERSILYNDRQFLGRSDEAWTDDDLNEFASLYGQCVRRFPSSGRPTADDLTSRIAKTVSMVKTRLIEPARERQRADRARADATRSLAEDRVKLELQRQQEVARSQREREDSERRQASERSQRARELLEEQAESDLKAAQEASRLAEAEAPKVQEAARRAEEARRMRVAAEQRLQDVRSKITAAEDERRKEDARTQIAAANQQQEAQREAERAEDEKLARVCRVKMDQFNRVQLGTSLREVQRVFGCKGVEVSGTRLAGYGVLTTFSWDGEVSPSNATGVFRNSRLESKSQVGLE